MAASRSSGGMPERTTRASRGPIPETAISRSKRSFSRSVQKPKSAMPSSRMWVWMKRRTFSSGRFSTSYQVERGMLTS